ncbi:MAG TPA: S8 family serine peptidase, partial [Actinopolymorphaceae bacterium]
AAPGADVLAAVAPPGNAGADFASYQGTSMSSPHIAGLAALLVSRHPGWNPMWIKSALMTTARQTDNRGEPIQRAGADATPLDVGAGHVNPPAAFEPGLVYDSGAADWVAYMCAIGQGQLVEAPCGDVADIDPSDLNTPSIAIGDLAGVQTLTRTVTNPGKRAGVYRAEVDAPEGTKVTVRPSRLVVPPKSSRTFTVRIERTDAAFGEYAFGSLTWKSRRHHGTDVRSPIAVRPVAVAAPPTVTGSGTSGSAEVELKAGYSGTLNAAAQGLVAAEETALELSDPTRESFDTDNPTTGPHTGKVSVTVPEGASLARFATFESDYADLGLGTDLDLFVYRKGADGLELVGYSASGGSDEAVTLTEPGDYEIYVDLWSLPEGVTSLTARHYHWTVTEAEGNLTVEPGSQQVGSGEPASLTASWSGLTEGVRYLGVVRYADAQSTVAQTILEITG